MVNPAYREKKPLEASKVDTFIIVREGKKPVVEKCPCFNFPHGKRMGEYQGQFTVTGVNYPEDGKVPVAVLANERVQEMERRIGRSIHFAIYEDIRIGNQRTWKCYAYSLDRQDELASLKDTEKK